MVFLICFLLLYIARPAAACISENVKAKVGIFHDRWAVIGVAASVAIIFLFILSIENRLLPIPVLIGSSVVGSVMVRIFIWPVLATKHIISCPGEYMDDPIPWRNISIISSVLLACIGAIQFASVDYRESLYLLLVLTATHGLFLILAVLFLRNLIKNRDLIDSGFKLLLTVAIWLSIFIFAE